MPRVLKSIVIKELSTVDQPAQVGARSLILKRGVTMDPKKDKTETNGLEKRLKELEDSLSLTKQRYDFLESLNDEQSAIYFKCSTEQRSEFHKAKKDELQELFSKYAEEQNPEIIYKSLSGATYTKEDDPRIIELAKQNDMLAKQNQEIQEQRSEEVFQKKASELIPNLTGTPTVHCALIKSVSHLPPETRDQIFEVLKAANDLIEKSSGEIGTSDSNTGDTTANDELSNIAKKIAKEENLTYLAAYEKAANLNPELLQKALGE